MTSSSTTIHVDLGSLYSVDAKNGLTHLDWTPDTTDTVWVLKWVLAGDLQKLVNLLWSNEVMKKVRTWIFTNVYCRADLRHPVPTGSHRCTLSPVLLWSCNKWPRHLQSVHFECCCRTVQRNPRRSSSQPETCEQQSWLKMRNFISSREILVVLQ